MTLVTAVGDSATVHVAGEGGCSPCGVAPGAKRMGVAREGVPARRWKRALLAGVLGVILHVSGGQAALLRPGEGVRSWVGQGVTTAEWGAALARIEAAGGWPASWAGVGVQGYPWGMRDKGATTLWQQAYAALLATLSHYPAQHHVPRDGRSRAVDAGSFPRLFLIPVYYDLQVMAHRLEQGLRDWPRLTVGQRMAVSIFFRSQWRDSNVQVAHAVGRVGGKALALGFLTGQFREQQRLLALLDGATQ